MEIKGIDLKGDNNCATIDKDGKIEGRNCNEENSVFCRLKCSFGKIFYVLNLLHIRSICPKFPQKIWGSKKSRFCHCHGYSLTKNIGWNDCTVQGPSYYRYDPLNLISNLETSSSKSCASTCQRNTSCVYWSYDTTNSKCALLPEGILDNTAEKEPNNRIRGDRSCYLTGCNEKLEVANTVADWDDNTFYETGSKLK